MKKLIEQLNNFLVDFDTDDFYSCKLKNGKIMLYSDYCWALSEKLAACGFEFNLSCVDITMCYKNITVIFVKKYPTNGHVK